MKIYRRPFLKISFLCYSAPFPLCFRYRQRDGRDTGKSHVKRFVISCPVIQNCLKNRFSLSFLVSAHETRALCVIAVRVTLPRQHSGGRPCRHLGSTPAVLGPAYFAAFARFPDKPHNTVRKFKRKEGGYLPMFPIPDVRAPPRKRNDAFLSAFVPSLLFLRPRMASPPGKLVGGCTIAGRRGQRRGASAAGRPGSVGCGRPRGVGPAAGVARETKSCARPDGIVCIGIAMDVGLLRLLRVSSRYLTEAAESSSTLRLC